MKADFWLECDVRERAAEMAARAFTCAYGDYSLDTTIVSATNHNERMAAKLAKKLYAEMQNFCYTY